MKPTRLSLGSSRGSFNISEAANTRVGPLLPLPDRPFLPDISRERPKPDSCCLQQAPPGPRAVSCVRTGFSPGSPTPHPHPPTRLRTSARGFHRLLRARADSKFLSLVRRFSPSTILPQRAWGSLWNMADSGTRSPDVSGKQFWAPKQTPGQTYPRPRSTWEITTAFPSIAPKSIQPKPIFIVSGWSGRSMKTYPSTACLGEFVEYS